MVIVSSVFTKQQASRVPARSTNQLYTVFCALPSRADELVQRSTRLLSLFLSSNEPT